MHDAFPLFGFSTFIFIFFGSPKKVRNIPATLLYQKINH